MPQGRSAATTAPKLTLGGLHRSLLAQLDPRAGLRVGIHFEERTSIPAEHAAGGTQADHLERRTFDADLGVRDGIVETASLTAGAVGAATLSVRVVEVGGSSRYSLGGGFGELRNRPNLFDLDDFESRLDAVPVGDAVVDLEIPDGSGRIVLDAAIDTDAFAQLLSVFGGNEPTNPEFPLLSHSVTLSAHSDVTLDYWWSLLGLDEVEGNPARNNVVVCHVQVSVAATSGAADAEPPVALDPALPQLEDLDAVWELARQSRPA
ncbi:MAG: hypothetical protein WCB51_01670 [Candidatus Dormiibacterota bacterium]